MRNFIKSILAKNEPKDMKACNPDVGVINIDMKWVRKAFSDEATTTLRDMKEAGHIGDAYVDVKSEGLTLTATIVASEFCTVTEGLRTTVPKTVITAEVENHPARPWTQSEFEQRVRDKAHDMCKQIEKAYEGARFERLEKYNKLNKFVIKDGRAQPYQTKREDVNP